MKNNRDQNRRNIATNDHVKERPEPDPLFDEEEWMLFMEETFHDRPEAAETFAWRLCELKRAIEQGPGGARRAVEFLRSAIRMVYPYTKVHQAALELFCVYLAHDVPIEAEPHRLLEGAIERAMSYQCEEKGDER